MSGCGAPCRAPRARPATGALKQSTGSRLGHTVQNPSSDERAGLLGTAIPQGGTNHFVSPTRALPLQPLCSPPPPQFPVAENAVPPTNIRRIDSAPANLNLNSTTFDFTCISGQASSGRPSGRKLSRKAAVATA